MGTNTRRLSQAFSKRVLGDVSRNFPHSLHLYLFSIPLHVSESFRESILGIAFLCKKKTHYKSLAKSDKSLFLSTIFSYSSKIIKTFQIAFQNDTDILSPQKKNISPLFYVCPFFVRYATKENRWYALIF